MPLRESKNEYSPNLNERSAQNMFNNKNSFEKSYERNS